MNVNPLFVSREVQRKHRFGRPNTNSPFPNMVANSNKKNKKGNNISAIMMPPTTAATST